MKPIRPADVSATIARHDPMKLVAQSGSADEYISEARLLAARLHGCSTSDMCLDMVWGVFRNAFGDELVSRGSLRRLSTDLFALKTVKTPPSDS
jgi:hypothetical protein